jgi:hypothetical protein
VKAPPNKRRNLGDLFAKKKKKKGGGKNHFYFLRARLRSSKRNAIACSGAASARDLRKRANPRAALLWALGAGGRGGGGGGLVFCVFLFSSF